jgi:hypothetical protein
MDCTHNHRHGWFHLRIIVLLILALGGGWFVARAQADGDPASDVLVTQSLFLPQDAGASPRQQVQMAGLLAEAGRAGDPVRAALIASPADLGSVSALWRQPQNYANFLGQELSLVYHGTLLVVMPNGYSVYGVGGAPTKPSALRGLPLPGSALGPAGIAAIRRLAGASGHTLPLPASAGPASSGSSNGLPWIIFGIGVVLIGLAWTASLRARPLGTEHQQADGLRNSGISG